MAAYQDNLEHLRDEMSRLDRLLERAVAQFRARRGEDRGAEFRGLCILDEEVDEIVNPAAEATAIDWAEAWGENRARAEEIQGRVAESAEAGVVLRLPHLCEVFRLDSFERDVLLLALAPELDLRYQKLYAYLQDDVLRKRPSVDLALRLLCPTPQARVAARETFGGGSALCARALLSLHEDSAESPSPLLGRMLKADDRVVEFLTGGDMLDRRLAAGRARWVAPGLELSDLIVPEETRAALQALAAAREGGTARRFCCLLEGPSGAGKKACAEALALSLGVRLLVVDAGAMYDADAALQTLVRVAAREAELYRAALYFDGWQEFLTEDPARRAALRQLEREIEDFDGPLFIGSHSPWQPASAPARRFVRVETPLPGESLRLEFWESCLKAEAARAEGIDASYLAAAFRFTGGQIRRALASARTSAWLRGGAEDEVTMEDVLAGCRAESSRKLVAFSKRIEPRRTWDDLVIPKDTLAQLRELCQQARHRVQVYDRWGFGLRLSLGKGLIALFTGQSGTGKTLSAEIIARELGLDLYRVDLSAVVSKYIGETEKNLSRVFDGAQQSSAVLFFDEADALFGKRTEVKDAHDRYANIEVNYLLQRVEEYEGVIILASNMSKNIDEAFLRRMHFSIEFPFPDEGSRLRIWRGLFPPQTPLSPDIEFDFLARKFKLAGGNIKNAALGAAFFAAADGGVVRMEHCVLALKREYQKLGRVCEKTDFEKYYALVR